IRFMKLYTFLPLEEIKKYESLKGEELRDIKRILAYEVTKIVHGEEKAQNAQNGAMAAFSGEGNIDLMPSIEIEKSRVTNGINVLDIFVESGLCSSKGEARRLIQQGGIRINDDKIDDEKAVVGESFITQKGILLKSGKKKIVRVIIK
ncbi:MAG: tyrosine--tRNA ligase, partial [Spirochaetes bacterium]|nr:tyrosine--tRNA ligase [Spirochaetota bacterium]